MRSAENKYDQLLSLCTLIREFNCILSCSRKWSREQKSAGSPVYGYIQGGIPGTLPGKIN